MKKITQTILLVFLSLSITMVSCKKNKDAPAIPDADTFEMNFNDFQEDNQKSADSTLANWGHAVTNVAVWNVILTINLAVPVASFKEAMNHDAQWHNNGDYWSWEYDVTVGLGTYTAELRAMDDGDFVNWEMYISLQGGFQDFLWYTGRSRKDGASGTWSLNQSNAIPTPFIDISWNNTSATKKDIQYTNVIPNAPGNGGYILYGIDGENDLDAFYNIYNAENENLIEIEWDRQSKNGRVKNEVHFNDAEWHCWDTVLQDTDC